MVRMVAQVVNLEYHTILNLARTTEDTSSFFYFNSYFNYFFKWIHSFLDVIEPNNFWLYRTNLSKSQNIVIARTFLQDETNVMPQYSLPLFLLFIPWNLTIKKNQTTRQCCCNNKIKISSQLINYEINHLFENRKFPLLIRSYCNDLKFFYFSDSKKKVSLGKLLF